MFTVLCKHIRCHEMGCVDFVLSVDSSVASTDDSKLYYASMLRALSLAPALKRASLSYKWLN